MIYKRVTKEEVKYDPINEFETEHIWVKTVYLFGIPIAKFKWNFNKELDDGTSINKIGFNKK